MSHPMGAVRTYSPKMGRSRNATLRAQHALTGEERLAVDGGIVPAAQPDCAAEIEPPAGLTRTGQTDE